MNNSPDQVNSPDDRQWQVRAVSQHGSEMHFGLRAPHHPAAVLRALDRLPFTTREITVTEIKPPDDRRAG
jgi:hypothetical protein